MTTTGDRQILSGDGQTTPGMYAGPVRIQLSGPFGGGTAKVQAEDPSGAFVDVAGSARTAADDFILDFPNAENNLQIDLSGSTSPALVVLIQGMRRSE